MSHLNENVTQKSQEICWPENFDVMVSKMLQCEQTAGQSVYLHGQSVLDHLSQLIEFLKGNHELPTWRIPSCFVEYKDLILANLHSDATLHLYCLYHDCGKPVCQEIDAETGKVRFPNHAQVSELVWTYVGGSKEVAKLIANDMVIHTANAEQIDQKLKEEWSKNDSITLLLASLSEVHSNARLFGGIDSISFKSKWKTIERRAKQIFKFYSTK